MPINDWTRVDAGLFHDFLQDWTVQLCRVLNAGRLPSGFVALIDLQTGGPFPETLTLHSGPQRSAALSEKSTNDHARGTSLFCGE